MSGQSDNNSDPVDAGDPTDEGCDVNIALALQRLYGTDTTTDTSDPTGPTNTSADYSPSSNSDTSHFTVLRECRIDLI